MPALAASAASAVSSAQSAVNVVQATPAVSSAPIHFAASGVPSEVTSAASAADIAAALKPFTPDALANGFSTLVGALFGAMLAFFLQYWFTRYQEKKAIKASAHKILFFVFQQINTILMIQRDFVQPHLKDPLRFISISATLDFEPEKDVVDYAVFAFMMDSQESRAILYDLWLAQQSYVEALRAWNMRSQFHNKEVQHRLAESIENGSMVSASQIEEALGVRVYDTITNATDAVLGTLKSAFVKLDAANTRLRAYIVAHFNSEDFTRFELPELYDIMDNDGPSPLPPAAPPGGRAFRQKAFYKSDGDWTLTRPVPLIKLP